MEFDGRGFTVIPAAPEPGPVGSPVPRTRGARSRPIGSALSRAGTVVRAHTRYSTVTKASRAGSRFRRPRALHFSFAEAQLAFAREQHQRDGLPAPAGLRCPSNCGGSARTRNEDHGAHEKPAGTSVACPTRSIWRSVGLGRIAHHVQRCAVFPLDRGETSLLEPVNPRSLDPCSFRLSAHSRFERSRIRPIAFSRSLRPHEEMR